MYINQNIDCRCILLWCENTNKELRGNLSSSLPSHTHITSYRTPISQISSERQLISIYCGLDTPLLLRPNQSYSLIPVNLIVKCQGPAENQCCASVHRELSRQPLLYNTMILRDFFRLNVVLCFSENLFKCSPWTTFFDISTLIIL